MKILILFFYLFLLDKSAAAKTDNSTVKEDDMLEKAIIVYDHIGMLMDKENSDSICSIIMSDVEGLKEEENIWRNLETNPGFQKYCKICSIYRVMHKGFFDDNNQTLSCADQECAFIAWCNGDFYNVDQSKCFKKSAVYYCEKLGKRTCFLNAKGICLNEHNNISAKTTFIRNIVVRFNMDKKGNVDENNKYNIPNFLLINLFILIILTCIISFIYFCIDKNRAVYTPPIRFQRSPQL